MANTQKKKRLAIALAHNTGKWVNHHNLADEARLSTRELGGLMRPLTHGSVVEHRIKRIVVYVAEYRCREGDVSRLLEGLQ